MPLTNQQVTTFFENADNLGIPQDVRAALREEGIDSVDDLLEFDKTAIEQIASNFRRRAPPVTFGAKMQKRMIEACDLVRFYHDIGRVWTPANLRYVTIRNFSQQWKSLMDRKEGDQPEVPKISKELGILRWSEAFKDFLHRCIGARGAPLSYVVRSIVVPQGPLPPTATDCPHTEANGSVENDLVAFASHDHPLYRDDSKKVYFLLEEASRGTSFAASLKPFQAAKDGREAFLAFMRQFAGKDKWDKELKRCNNLLNTRTWKGQSNFTLERFVSQHRNAFITMQQCSEHVSFQLPNELTRVKYLLDAIDNSNAELQAAIAMIRQDDEADGKMNNFEAAAAYLIPCDPVAKKQQVGSKRPAADISSANIQNRHKKKKAGMGVTGVELRFHNRAEYNKLNKLQKAELYEWRKSVDSKKESKDDSKDQQKKIIAAAVKKELKDAETAKAAASKDKEDLKALIMTVLGEVKTPASAKVNISNVNSSGTTKDPMTTPIPKTLKSKIKAKQVSAVEAAPTKDVNAQPEPKAKAKFTKSVTPDKFKGVKETKKGKIVVLDM